MVDLIKLLTYSRKHRRRVVLAATCSALNKLFDIAPEALIGVAVDVVVSRGNSWLAKLTGADMMHQLCALGALTLVIWFFESAFQYMYDVLWRNLAQSVQHDLRIDCYRHVQNLDMAFFETQNSGDLGAILNDDVNQLERFLNVGANELIQVLVNVTVVGAIFFYFSPLIGFLAFTPIPVITYSAFFFQRRLQPRYADVRRQAGSLAARLANNLSGVAVIKSFTTEDHEVNQLRTQSSIYQDVNSKAIQWSAAFVPVVRMAVLVGFIATLILGGWMTYQDKLAVGSYSALVFLTQRLLWPFTRLAETVDLYQRAMASVRRVFNLLEQPVGTQSGSHLLTSKQAGGALTFESVSFRYRGREATLTDVQLTVDAGSTVAFVGPTGSGKSTLIKLLLRFYEPEKGRILLDGEDIRSFSVTSLRKAIGVVSQDVFLFDGTIAENIAYGTFDATKEMIVAAARVAEADAFIMTMPHGYNTAVGERGHQLSGGQRQRLSLARAVLKNLPILVLDEATSAIDNETEASIQQSLEHIVAGRTTLVVAHRLSTIRHADTIFVLDGGRIVEAGTHDSLLALGHQYAALWQLQAGQSRSREKS